METNDYGSYKYLRPGHVTAMCFGFPYNRRKIKKSNEYGENSKKNLTGNIIIDYTSGLNNHL